MNRVSRARILAAYRDGVTVICELAAQFDDARWLAATPCSEWRAVDLAGHLRCVADDYHEYLDDAPASRLARLMATGAPADSLARKLARQNSAELAALPDATGPEHIAAFAESARSYGRRLPLSWDLPHHRYRGTDVTVGAMAGVACAEWHLHAWDLARSLGKDYRPADPELVLTAWRDGSPQLLTAGPEGDDPWHFLLIASGRDPDWVLVLECCASRVIIQLRRVVNGLPRTVPGRAMRGRPGAVRRRLAGTDPGRIPLPCAR
jgi:hypothetical protein